MTRLLGHYDNEAAAQLARLRLEESGIRAEVVGGALSGFEGWPIAFRGVQLLVTDADFERAAALLATDRGAAPDAELEPPPA